MEQIYTLFCSFPLFIIDSLNDQYYQYFKNKELKKYSRIFKDTEKYSRTTRCFSRIKDETSFNSKSKDILGAQGRLATLVETRFCESRSWFRF